MTDAVVAQSVASAVGATGEVEARLLRLDSSEKSLVLGLRAGDDRAWETLVERYEQRMLAVGRSFLKDEDAAHDAWQEALLSVFRSIDSFAGEARLGTWLYRIVANVCLMKLRSRRRQYVRLEGIEHLGPGADGPGRSPAAVLYEGEARVQHHQLRRWLREQLEVLPEDYRQVIVMRDLEDRSGIEVAALLGASPNAVKIRLHRARRALREVIEPSS